MKVKLYISFLFIPFSIFSQQLLPFIENFSKINYQGDNQVWSIAQSKDASIYFANNHYLLRYDGVKWEKKQLPSKTIIRSVFVNDDKIYTGSYKEFGYWVRKEGIMYYTSLSEKKLLFLDHENEEIWKIFKLKNIIYFQSFNNLYLYDGKNIKKIKIPFLISYCYNVDNDIYLASVNQGLYKLKDTKIEKIKNWEILENNIIHGIEKCNNTIYFFTLKNGVYVVENNVISAWKNPLNTVLKSANINVAHFISNNKLAIGTARQGVFIVDLITQQIQKLNYSNVLKNNSVLNLFEDQENNLWLGLDNGISHIELNTPASIFYDYSGELGSVYSVSTTQKGYLLASNQGVFKYENNIFSPIPGMEGQAWSIRKFDNQYFIGHTSGTYLFENEIIKKINNLSGCWNFIKSNVNNSYLQATYSGIFVYPNIKDLGKKIEIKNLSKPIKYVAQNKKNEIWAADNYKGLYRIICDDNYNTISVENVTENNKIQNDYSVKIFEFRNQIFFLINNSWFTYNEITNKLEVNVLFDSNLKNISNITTIDDSNFMVYKNGIVYLIKVVKGKFIWTRIQEKYYKGKIINENFNAFKTKNSYLLNLDDGFLILKTQYKYLQDNTVQIEAYENEHWINNKSNIEKNSVLRLDVITHKLGATKSDLFYKINNETEYIPVTNNSLNFYNLSSGKYTITFFSNDGLNYKKAANFFFQVNLPWYFSVWMLLIYIIIIALFIYLYQKWNNIKQKQILNLFEEELKHQNKLTEMELKAKNDLEKETYQKHILELKLQTKSSEIASKSLSIAKQSDMITIIQDILDNETDFNKLKNEIKKAIKINDVNKQEWKSFETNLNQIHNEFIKNLTQKFPNLTPKDIKLCVHLKMNLSSKEIAPIMNISFRGVELHRYRLRKKLRLNQDENLSKFLLSI